MATFTATSSSSPRERLSRLMAQRDALEAEAEAIASELNSPGPEGQPPAGIKTPLVDVEGFPRGDIDLFNVRNKRQRLAVINTDHKALMLEIGATLQALHREQEPSSASSGSSTSSSSSGNSSSSSSVGGSSRRGGSGPEVVTVTSKAFAVIDEILEGSPAATAGVHDGDELLQFGSVTSLTTDALNSLPAVVRDHVNRPIAVTVRRKDVLATLTLVPQSWGGRGLVGCHFTPITQM